LFLNDAINDAVNDAVSDGVNDGVKFKYRREGYAPPTTTTFPPFSFLKP